MDQSATLQVELSLYGVLLAGLLLLAAVCTRTMRRSPRVVTRRLLELEGGVRPSLALE
jgi:hypothetical protein